MKKSALLSLVASLLLAAMVAIGAPTTAQAATCPHPGYYDNTNWNLEVEVPMDVRSGPAMPCPPNGSVGHNDVVHYWCSVQMPDGWVWDFVSYPANTPKPSFKGWVPYQNIKFQPNWVPCVPGG